MPQATSRSAARQVLQRSQADPAWFAHHVLGVELWSKQREIIEAVRDNRRTAVRSCHGIGKTFDAGVAALWFLYSFPNSRVVTTAPTWTQVEKLLWHEIRQLHARARFPLGGRCLTTEVKLDDGRYAVGLSTDPHRQESFQGHHAEHILLIFDEASGVPQPIYEAGEGYMTADGARWLMIGNPTQPSGEFFDAFHHGRSGYARIHVGYEDTPAFTGEKVSPALGRSLISKAWVEEKRAQWGEESPMWQVRVLGDFPSYSDNTVISIADVEAAQARDLPPDPNLDTGRVSCDVARFGSDETVIASLVGKRVRIERVLHQRATTEVAGAILDVARNLDCEGFPELVVDDDGVGGGVTDILRDQGYRVDAFRAGAAARQTSLYPNARSEGWFTLSGLLPGLDLDPDAQLAADLVAPRYQLDPAGRRRVEKKDETKKRLGNRSPDRGDAVFMLVAPTDTAPTEGPRIWT